MDLTTFGWLGYCILGFCICRVAYDDSFLFGFELMIVWLDAVGVGGWWGC